ncbi:MAG: queuosine precursor transporter [Actinobacteria bacterium]|nr:queuosine precursor transporter [Actinomycetota bacterium]
MSHTSPNEPSELGVPDLPAKFAIPPAGNYAAIVAAFCGVLLISNIGATKLIEFGPIITDGGAFLFPLVYIIGDILSEVYGFKAARKAILLGFGLSILAALTFWLVQISPPAASWENQEAFEAVIGFVPRIVLASIAGFLVGQLLNAYVLVKIKERTREKALWLRLLGSSFVGELADTVVFCTIAFYGVITGGEFLNYVIIGYIYKTAVEVILLPVTYRVIAAVKKREPTYAAHAPEPESIAS